MKFPWLCTGGTGKVFCLEPCFMEFPAQQGADRIDSEMNAYQGRVMQYRNNICGDRPGVAEMELSTDLLEYLRALGATGV